MSLGTSRVFCAVMNFPSAGETSKVLARSTFFAPATASRSATNSVTVSGRSSRRLESPRISTWATGLGIVFTSALASGGGVFLCP